MTRARKPSSKWRVLLVLVATAIVFAATMPKLGFRHRSEPRQRVATGGIDPAQCYENELPLARLPPEKVAIVQHSIDNCLETAAHPRAKPSNPDAEAPPEPPPPVGIFEANSPFPAAEFHLE